MRRVFAWRLFGHEWAVIHRPCPFGVVGETETPGVGWNSQPLTPCSLRRWLHGDGAERRRDPTQARLRTRPEPQRAELVRMFVDVAAVDTEHGSE